MTDRTVRTAKIVAVVAGVLGILLALAAPFLPVKYSKTELVWPQSGGIVNVAAPNVSYVPVDMDISVPCALAADLPKSGGVLLSTVPDTGVEAGKVGLFIRATSDRLIVTQRNGVLLSVPRAQAQSTPGCRVEITSDTSGTRGSVQGFAGDDGTQNFALDDPDARPQIIGVYTGLPKTASAEGLSFRSTIDTRFSSSPTALKGTLLIIGVLATIVSMLALAVLDARDGRRVRRWLPRRWWRPRIVDVVVVGALVLWLFIGGNTADDGYQVTVGRVAPDAGYLDNYYRYFGAPQDPFGWHYQYLALWMQVSTATPWLRLLPLLFALVAWFLISRIAIARLGRSVRVNQAAYWAAGLGFLAVWLPFNNGLRVEPILSVGVLLTWILVERSIATGRFFPLTLAILSAAFTLTIHPAGAIAILPLLAALRPLVKRLRIRARRDGLLPLLIPVLAAGMAVLFEIFADQPLAAIREGITVQGIVGPTNKWWTEGMRYYILLNPTPDGSIARRIGIFVTFLAAAIIVLVLLSKRRVPGVASAPLWRLLAVSAGAVAVLAFVPTKATHQMGAFAALTGVLAAAATAFLTPAVMRRRCNRTFVAAAAAYALAVAFAGRNQWWYVGSYGIPWGDDTPNVRGIGLFVPILLVAVALTAYGAWQYYRDDRLAAAGADPAPAETGSRVTGAVRAVPTYSLAIIAGFTIAFTFVSFAKAINTQRDSWSWASANVDAFRGKPCALAEAVLVEADPNTGLLNPAKVAGQSNPSPGAALAGTGLTGFVPDGVSAHLESDAETEADGSNEIDRTQTDPTKPQEKPTGTAGSADTGGGTTGTRGVNGSSVRLPFNLDPTRVPVLGTSGIPGGRGHLQSDWYQLPERSADRPLVTISVAGYIEYIDELAVRHPGQKLRLEFGRVEPDGRVTTVASMIPLDLDAAPEWRNLRFPLDQAPPRASVVRVVADDTSADPRQWLALTPPRVTELVTLNSLVGSEDPVLLDWEVAFAFPCQRPATVVHGVLETPKWRITPDAEGERVNSRRWMAGDYGGPLGIVENELRPTVLPSYLRNDWAKDWGSLQRLTPLKPQVPAELVVTDDVRPGWWTPGPMRAVKN
ncbi:arabinosyltransferase domain-containing protein [Gordonia sp. ABSL1-1]|uniref:arabinosyltransferase domain-containing protein n=1 Tax=Gordonia sp. ABSL1-1 TaxID=3053923 RepID=UPI0025729D08|nr:arabinosyltransferase domain-containing protein [Gordonia sp. ABSL1-1]MDL9937657.1 arabinosyltransferase domain-containing protein [Gordonia sp. ABSL1-1]